MKTEFAVRKKLAGAMVWSIDTDDFLGECSKGPNSNDRRFNQNFPLMRTINEVLAKQSNEIDDNFIEDNQDGGATGVVSSLMLVLGCIVLLY